MQCNQKLEKKVLEIDFSEIRSKVDFYFFLFGLSRHFKVQSTLVISTSLISNNRLSRSEKSGPCCNMEI